MKELKYIIVLAVFIISVAACDNHEDAVEMHNTKRAMVTLLAPLNGMGDNSYNDRIAEGVFAFARNSNTRLRLMQPDNGAEAIKMYRRWLSDNASNDSAVIILCGSAYEMMAEQTSTSFNGTGCRVLMVESCSDRMPDGVSTFYINRYGASWLAGAMSGEFDANVIAAAPRFKALEDAISGFRDGHSAHDSGEHAVNLTYLADGEEGFVMPDSAYRVMFDYYSDGTFMSDMIFPLIGESGKGIIRYANSNVFFASLIIGMDVDQKSLCPRIPFSMVVRIDDVVEHYLNDWISGREWPKRHTFNMSSGYVDIVITPNFTTNLNIWDDRYENPDAFTKLYEKYHDEAIEKEKDHD